MDDPTAIENPAVGGAPRLVPPSLARLPSVPGPPGWRIAAAWRAGARLRGLLGVRSLPADVGLWVRPTRAVHTVGMRMALDLVWLDAAGDVVWLHEEVGPWRHRACRRARGGVVEVAAGRGDALARAIGEGGGLRPTGTAVPSRRRRTRWADRAGTAGAAPRDAGATP